MPVVNCYYSGATARTIRQYVRQQLNNVLTTILNDAGLTVGEGAGQIVLLKSSPAAQNRMKEGKGFIFSAFRPTKPEPIKVRDVAACAAHSGMRHHFDILLQVSAANVGSTVHGEAIVQSDDELIDIVRAGLEERYAYFRDEKFFFDLNVAMVDDAKEGANVVNPLRVTFYVNTRLPVDEFITVP